MAFWPFRSRSKELLERFEKVVADIRLATQREAKTTPGEFQQQVKESRRLGKRDIALGKLTQEQARAARQSVDAEISCVYDLGEIIRLQDIESFFRVSVDRHVELIMKNGFRLKGKNPEVVDYVKSRITEIEIISDQPFGDMLRELVRNTVTTHNGYWVFSRDQSRSTGRKIKLWGKTLDPIAAISVPDPSTVKVKQTATGRPYAWIQRVVGHIRPKTWQHHDVIHIPVGRKSGFIHGTPYAIPVLEDIRALRKFEMLSEHVGHKFAFPFMHWKVGTDDWPAGITIDPDSGLAIADIDAANNYAESMAQEGFVVTSHRHEIQFIGLEGEVFDLKPYIQHYEARVLSGLRVSEVDLGRGDTSNRGTAQVMNKVLVDACQEYQDVISQYITMKFLNILVMEGGYSLNDQNKVYLSWPPIDTEEARAKEAHGLNLYVQGGITRPELRMDYLERDEITPAEEEGMHLFRHLEPLLEMETASQIKIAKAKPAAGTSGSGSGEGGASKAGASAAKRSAAGATATNQYGRLATRPRFPKNDLLKAWRRMTDTVIERARKREQDGLDHDLGAPVRDGLVEVWKIVRPSLLEEWARGFHEVDAGEHKLPRVKENEPVLKFLDQFYRRDLHRLSKTLMIAAGIDDKTGHLGAGRDVANIMPAFETALGLLSSKLDRGFKGANLLGRLQAVACTGVDQVHLVEEGCDDLVAVQDTRMLLGIAGNPAYLDRTISVNGTGA